MTKQQRETLEDLAAFILFHLKQDGPKVIGTYKHCLATLCHDIHKLHDHPHEGMHLELNTQGWGKKK